MRVTFLITPGKQGTPMRRVAADGGSPSVNGYGGPIRRLALGAALAFLVSLAVSDQAQSENANFTRAAAPPAKVDKKEDDKKKTEVKQDKTGNSKKEKRLAFTMDGKPWKSVFQ